MRRLDQLAAALREQLGAHADTLVEDLGELTLTLPASALLEVAALLRDDEALAFSELLDLCGVDYAGYGGSRTWPARYASVSHLLSIRHNWRLRLRVFAPDDSLPVLPSLCGVWPSANWFEREAFDLFGILFEGHPDLRRILTDYGFIGHPFRKDFPVSGFMEMIYDEEQGRVIYQPVTIAPRENTPRIVREESYGGGRG
ncbi:MAG: NADH-quinone oxidoreductase subunit C [Candidatus Dactylopiibacterium carminicum]|uniref:NADH-quinone oxidoreductase subunit C n=2 Tax=Candidatus Dactylopiibacterium carminicum TaxID=857335 RepID=A0A272EQ27_9RHOO|nr:NADH-quinone oxidoreductase subunit C [Candidatus Dactylopiibacterium carminicum]PAS92181.1 MAG: NADH-quinone oxidoreductase subunit C [Candidatus Dactylopiibacterium carminicum]PAS95668.1 MAG: NADH-quinone oxidoreductase subunit C [Candidatus Dactylopiibacterium carminicum]PAS97660.1 MAG: NADH-quinone oxidoreductase subunit C [Candidatus Dactylopiibacterium carminicum]